MSLYRRGAALVVAVGLTLAGPTAVPAFACGSAPCATGVIPTGDEPEDHRGQGDQDQRSVLDRLADFALSAAAAVDDALAQVVRQITEPGMTLPGPLADDSREAPGGGGSALRDRSAFLIPGGPDGLPGRWCAGPIPLYFDFTQAGEAGLDITLERALWQRAADAWSSASGGSYSLRVAGFRTIHAASGSTAVAVDDVPRFSVAITYGGERGDVPWLYSTESLAGATAGYAGLTVVTGGTAENSGRAESGYVIIDAHDVVEGLSDPDRRLQLYTHELGHALGLAHTAGEDSIMGPEIALDARLIGRHDEQSLQTLAELPCQD